MILSNSWFFMLFAPYFCYMESTLDAVLTPEMLSFEAFKKSVLEDYRIALMSREVSLLGRREVLTGKAKFGIFGDGKEIAQIALAKFFQKGDFRSGYYRDQTLMFAMGTSNVEDYFAQLYSDVENDPYSGGKNMNAHFATSFVNEKNDAKILMTLTSPNCPVAESLPVEIEDKVKSLNTLTDTFSLVKSILSSSEMNLSHAALIV